MKSLGNFYTGPFLWTFLSLPLIYCGLYFIGYMQYFKLVTGCMFIIYIPIALVVSGLNSTHDTIREINEKLKIPE